MTSINSKLPKLRFKGFSGEWNITKLCDISDKVQEKNKDNLISETFTNSAEFGIISQRDFFNKDISNEVNLCYYYVVQPNDFVYNPRISNSAPVGPIKRNKLNRTGVMSPLYYVFRTHSINNDFLDYYFSTSKWHRFMFMNGDKGARSDRFAISDSVFRTMPIFTPKQQEQTQIGNFFQKLDQVIELQQNALTQAQNYKKAMLQKMFPQKGEKVPRVRFKGVSGEWNRQRLREYTKLITKGTTPKNQLNTGPVNFVKVENISYGIIKPNTKISQEEHENYLRRSKLEENDILFSIAGTLGRVAIVNKSILPANTNQALSIIRGYDYDTYFLMTILSGKVVADYIRKNPTVGAQPNLSLEQIGNLEIWTPSIQEQTKIGNFFQQLDQQITEQRNKLTHYQTLKKAMLPRLFI